MWDKPQLLNALADLLFVAAAAAILSALTVWMVRMPALPVRQVVVKEELRQVRRVELEQALNGLLAGNFFSVNLENIRSSVESLPWVRRAEVRRRWPAGLELRIEEHQPVARWEDGVAHVGKNELVDSYGDVFVAALGNSEAAQLPQVYGPAGTAPELIRHYGEFSKLLAPIGQKPLRVSLSARLAWQIKLSNGTVLDLGREQSKSPVETRLGRFVEIYPETVGKLNPPPAVVDLRYPNGFAVRSRG